MDNALKTLFYLLDQHVVNQIAPNSNICFLNAQWHSDLHGFNRDNLFLQQYSRSKALVLEENGFCVSPVLDIDAFSAGLCFLLMPKNFKETRIYAAQALLVLKEGGILVIAGDNKAGGTRIAKMLGEFGLDEFEEVSKHKARAALVRKVSCDEAVLETVLKEGQRQKVLDGQFISQPGIYGWDKIDQGSALLLEHIPSDLSGAGADFGCGYGFLAKRILDNKTKISHMSLIDADYRALQACEENLQSFDVTCEFLWEDLRRPVSTLKNLDWVIMNPPFHDGKQEDFALGQAFIGHASQALRTGGMLYMVANRHLPYEQTLEAHFKDFETVYEGAGYKVFAAHK